VRNLESQVTAALQSLDSAQGQTFRDKMRALEVAIRDERPLSYLISETLDRQRKL